jgi:hypothetical protein
VAGCGESDGSIFGRGQFGTFKTGDLGFRVLKVPNLSFANMDVALSVQGEPPRPPNGLASDRAAWRIVPAKVASPRALQTS